MCIEVERKKLIIKIDFIITAKEILKFPLHSSEL